ENTCFAKSTPIVIVRMGNSSSRHTDGENHHGPLRPSGYPQGWGVSFLLIQADVAPRRGLTQALCIKIESNDEQRKIDLLLWKDGGRKIYQS
ncbi:MAG: hypothetical protein ABIJ73_03455, partial [Pseudomonadota bacterium]